MRKFRELNADTKQRISQALKGRGLTDNHKQAISDGMRAYWTTNKRTLVTQKRQRQSRIIEF